MQCIGHGVVYRPTCVFTAITFRVSSQNRYKLTKKYRQLVEQHGESLEDPELAHTVSVAKVGYLFEIGEINYNCSVPTQISPYCNSRRGGQL